MLLLIFYILNDTQIYACSREWLLLIFISILSDVDMIFLYVIRVVVILSITLALVCYSAGALITLVAVVSGGTDSNRLLYNPGIS